MLADALCIGIVKPLNEYTDLAVAWWDSSAGQTQAHPGASCTTMETLLSDMGLGQVGYKIFTRTDIYIAVMVVCRTLDSYT
jgi:hypothetical protein